MKRLTIVVPVTRLDSENHMVYGYASTGRIDTYDSIVDPAWWPQAVTGYKAKRTVSEMHLDLYGEPRIETGREPMVVGTVPILEIDDRGLWIGAEISNSETWERIESNEYNGFSVDIMPYEYREEVIDGRTIIRFTKYHLNDITVGYPAANIDARFTIIERLAYDEESAWDWDWSKDADAIVDKLGWKGLEQTCLYKDPDGDPETKAAYKLPVAKLKNGELTIFWNGCRAAMAVLNGGRGGVDIPEEAREKAYKKLKTYYNKFGRDIPELRLDNGGETMTTFVKKVTALVQRLTGKAPDETATKEIEQLETELAGEQSKQIDELTETVKGLTERLEKVESEGKDEGGDGDTTDEPDKIGEISDTLKKIEERLETVEKKTASTQQPGEAGTEQTKANEGDGGIFKGVLLGIE
jgi:hypothetical protein